MAGGCRLRAGRSPSLSFLSLSIELGTNTLGLMEGATSSDGVPSCGKCDPPFAGTSATFRQFLVPGLDVPEEPWLGTFGGPGHDHREEVPAAGLGPN